MDRKIKRGEMYFADLDPIKGSEQAGFRPVLILQNDIGNAHSTTTIAAPITSKSEHKTKLPTHVKIKAAGALTEDSMVLLEQIRTLDKQRIHDYVGILGSCDMNRVEKAMSVSLAFDL